MHKAIDTIQQLKAKIQLEDVYNYLIIIIIVVILSLSLIALRHPITIQQQQHVTAIAQQSYYADTQEMAVTLLAKDQITMGQYLKLMHALQYEKHRAKQLPALSLDN
ncbi:MULTISPECIES: hypothetical protein [unclassified Acinetobacter]|uniref:hypothetical protein n=1 Tax=unclassified Acinetobacter TaxID=196816 RepID=UPI0029346E9B|nr:MULTISPECIES: hypothetical protein [unclassified Acinetobacter]WOE31939.1 hypothetical protein QSG84_01560 [Acinetobacter sp. SAAs470]WOE37407.1 hypothetical protein QSG86_10605 [Acinetobacter sp. SAAs474]